MDGSPTARTLAKFWFLTVAVLAVAILYLAKVLFLPLAFAILFGFLLFPVVGLLERIHLPRALAAVVVILSFGTLVGGAAWLAFTQLVSIANDLPVYRDNITVKMQAIHAPANSAISHAQQEMEELSQDLGLANSPFSPPPLPGTGNSKKPLGSTPEHPVQVREVARPAGRLDQLHGIAEPITTAFLTIVFTFFVMLQREDLRNRLIRLSGEQNLTMMTHAMNDASARISRYFQLQLLVNLCYGSLVFIALSLIGLPHPLFFGALATLSRFIPYFGALTAALLPIVLSIAVFQGWSRTLEIVCLFLFLEIFTANYAEPHIYGRHTGLTSLAILAAAAFWAFLWGPVGLLLSMPLTVCLVVIGRHFPSLEFLTVMLGDRPAIPPPTSLYQRLVARDEREAADILDTCLKGDTLENIYDKVVIPALLMSERDRQQGELVEPGIHFIHQTMRELIEELGFKERGGEEKSEPDSATGSAAPKKVLCVPVRDETDELGAMMLAQLLESSGVHASAISASGVDDVMANAVKENPDMVFLSALPPIALARAHRMYRLLRARNQNLMIMLGFWGSTIDTAAAAQKFTREEGFRISTSLADAVSQVRSAFNLDEKEPADQETAMSADSAA